MDCKNWLENYIKKNQPVRPHTVYAAGKQDGFSRKEIKQARSWHGKYIDTQTAGSETFWRWAP